MAKKELLDLYGLEVQPIDDNFSHYTVTITGDGGVGKSTFANALFNRFAPTVTFGCEDRFKGIKDIKLVPIDSWDTLTKYKTMIKKGLKENGKLPFTNIIIDPIGQLGKMCEDFIKEENGVDDMKDVGFGGAYTQFEEELYGTIRELRELGVNVSFVAHGKNEQITPPRQEAYNVQMPDIQKRLIYLVNNEVDFLLYLTTVRVRNDDGEMTFARRLYLQGYPEYKLKVPLDGFPEYIEWSGSVEEGVDKFIEAFNRAVEITRSGSGEVVKASDTTKKSTDRKDKKVKVDEDDAELTELRDMAVEVRDNMLENMPKADVIKALKDTLGMAKISECTNIDKLNEFINTYKE